MEYIVKKRFRGLGIDGKTHNLLRGTRARTVGKVIVCGNDPICGTVSEAAYEYFARNDDGRGIDRGVLIDRIREFLSIPVGTERQERWGRLWDDPSLARFRRDDHPDFWIWNFDFYNAEIEDLERIYRTAKGG